MKTPHRLSRRQFVGQLSLATAAALTLPRGLRAADSAAPEKKLGIAILGLGGYAGGQIAPKLQLTKLCRLTGLISGTPSKLQSWGSKYNIPEKNRYSYEDLEHVADNPEIDIVYVITPPGTHRDFVVRLAKTGKHVICENPMAPTVAECDEMIAAMKAAGKQLSIGYRLHFEPHHQEMDRLVAEPGFGPMTKMKGGFGFHLNGQQWRIDKKLAGGGPLPDVGVYVLQAARRAARAWPIAVTAQEQPKKRPDFFTEVEETITFKLEYPGGAICDGWASYEDSQNGIRAENASGENWVEVRPAFNYGGVDGRSSRGPMNLPNVPQQALQMDDFARCVLENRPTPVPGEMGRGDVATIEAIYASAAAGGKRVEVKI
jgi:glucose-fructose oxidoreductase